MKNLLYLLTTLILASSCVTPTSNENQENESIQEEVVDLTAEENAVKKIMKTYKETLESLDVTDSYVLFTENSQVLEQGKIEGTYRDYIANHIGPELGHFESFTFNEYEIEVAVDMPYAFTTESYIYNIVLKKDGRKVERKAAATSILKKIDDEWKIIKTHSSSRVVK
ncbi:MAG: YybH family protein [Candidatus Cyclobacteriaceae bacterium M2_1C_046]